LLTRFPPNRKLPAACRSRTAPRRHSPPDASDRRYPHACAAAVAARQRPVSESLKTKEPVERVKRCFVPCSPLFRGCLTSRERSSILTCEAPTLRLELRCANAQGVLEAHLASSRHLSEWPVGQRRVQGARDFKRHAHMHVLSPSLSFWLFCRFCINSCPLS